MDLDNLKELLKDLDLMISILPSRRGIVPAVTSHEEEIVAILRKRSQNPIAKIKRNLATETIVIVVLYSITMWYYNTAWKGQYWEISNFG